MITIKDVEHVAKLARLELTEEEKEKFTKQLDDVLKHVDAMNEVDTSNVEPMVLLPIGYPVESEPSPKKRKTIDEIVVWR